MHSWESEPEGTRGVKASGVAEAVLVAERAGEDAQVEGRMRGLTLSWKMRAGKC